MWCKDKQLKLTLFHRIVILLTTFFTIYLQLNLSLPPYLQAFAESYQAQVLWPYRVIFTAGSRV